MFVLAEKQGLYAGAVEKERHYHGKLARTMGTQIGSSRMN